MKTELNGQGQKHQLKQHQQHQLIKCRKKGKFYLLEIHAFNGTKIVKSSLCGKKLSSSSVRKQLLKKNQVKKNVASVQKDVKPKHRKKVSLSLKPFGIKTIATKAKTTTPETTTITTTLPLSSSSSSLPRTLSPLKYTLSSSTSLLSSSSSSLLQTLPSPTDEFKSWQSSSSLSTVDVVDIDGGIQEDNKKPSNVIIKPNNVEKDSIDEDNLRLLRLRRNLDLLAGITSLLTATATTLIKSPITAAAAASAAASAAATSSSTSTGCSSFSNNNSNNNLSNDQRRNPFANRLTSVICQRALLWKNRQRQLEQLHSRFSPQLIEEARRRHIQNLSITLRRPTIEGNSNTSNNNNNNNNNIISSITNNTTNNFNNNFGYIFNGLGIKRPLVQDDPSEPEPTSKENIKRIKIANGYQNVSVLDDRYLFMRKIEGTTFYYCIDARAKKKLMCKVSLDPCTKLIEAHAKFNGHPCISQLLKVIRKDNKTYMFFPMPQDDLLSYVRKRKRLPERDVRFLFLQMCAIVKSCHNHGIVLRDLKLRKFVFSDSFRKHLKLESLVDAVVLDDPTNDVLKEKRGCPVYVAPEILKATQTYCGKAADMWSLGVILYTMLIGRYPFSDTEHAGLFAKISRGQFLLPDIISPKARCLIRCLLRQEPEERITSDDIFYHPWMNFSDSIEMNLSNTDQCVPNNDYVNDVDNVGKNTGGSSNIRRF